MYSKEVIEKGKRLDERFVIYKLMMMCRGKIFSDIDNMFVWSNYSKDFKHILNQHDNGVIFNSEALNLLKNANFDRIKIDRIIRIKKLITIV